MKITQSMLRLSLVFVAAVLAVAFFVPTPASACSGGGCRCQVGDCTAVFPCGSPCPCGRLPLDPPPLDLSSEPLGSTVITPLGDRRVQITVSGFLSTGMTGGDVCTTALGHVPGLERVNTLRVFDSLSGQLLREVSFDRNEATGASFAAEAPALGFTADRWLGFFGQVYGDVESGRLLTFVLEARLARGANLGTLAEQLRNGGLIGTAAAYRDGTVNSQHLHFRALGDTEISIAPRRPERDPRGGAN